MRNEEPERGPHWRINLGLYMLVGHEPLEMHCVEVWGMWYGQANLRVARDTVGDRWISTVFLGVDHGWFEGKPILFETMVFKNESCDESIDMQRYATWDEALAGHNKIVEELEYEYMKRRTNEVHP